MCDKLTSGVNSCPGCKRFIHSICGRGDREGYGASVWCPKCEFDTLSREAEVIRAGVKRNQQKLHERMLQSSAKRFQAADVGDNVIIPIERPDKMNSLGQHNLMGVVMEVNEGNYTIATRDWMLNDVIFSQPISTLFSAVCSTLNCIIYFSVPDNCNEEHFSRRFCRCLHCKANRCPCKKSSRSCNTKCYKWMKCFNSSS